jgi:hypothetical protein
MPVNFAPKDIESRSGASSSVARMFRLRAEVVSPGVVTKATTASTWLK